ncbi:MAG: hypothetical protein ACQESR_31020 [Planctomycetota bacterium]
MSRKRIILLTAFAVTIVACICLAVFSHNISVAYHYWRMEAAYESLFGNPRPLGNGVAEFEVTAKDVDAAIAAYKSHRQTMVDLGAFAHIKASFPTLALGKKEEHSEERSDFVNRMWRVFANHRHYWLRPDGEFEAWVPVADEHNWQEFLKREAEALGEDPH